MAKKKLPSMPKTIYAYEEEDGDEKYLVSHYKIEDTCEKNEVRLVGKYELVECGEVTAIPQFLPVRRS